ALLFRRAPLLPPVVAFLRLATPGRRARICHRLFAVLFPSCFRPVFGYSDGPVDHAFVYRNGAMTDLNDYLLANSGWLVLTQAQSINAGGQIVGTGITANATLLAVITNQKRLGRAAAESFAREFPQRGLTRDLVFWRGKRYSGLNSIETLRNTL